MLLTWWDWRWTSKTFKLLGVYISDDLKWARHVDALASTVASRICFLTQLKSSGASTEDVICFLPQSFDQYWNTPGILTSQLDNLICWNHCKNVHWRSFSVIMTIICVSSCLEWTLYTVVENIWYNVFIDRTFYIAHLVLVICYQSNENLSINCVAQTYTNPF